MGCMKCRAYEGRCTLGKANPKTRKDTEELMKVWGMYYVCSNNKWRDRIKAKMEVAAKVELKGASV